MDINWAQKIGGVNRLPPLTEDVDQDVEQNKQRVWSVEVPANVYDGKYYDYRTVRVLVVAPSEKEAMEVVNANKPAVLAELDKKRMRVGDRLVRWLPKDIEKNVFFKPTYSVRLANLLYGKALTKDGTSKLVVS